MILDKINEPNDIKKIDECDLDELSEEIRQLILDTVSVTGGHLASNLGSVELTIALHRLMTFPSDKLIWDVGHQSYTHKILTGRKQGFYDKKLRQMGGLTGFPNPDESDCDPFYAGHSSNSISLGIGLVRARELSGKNNKVVSVIGDGALTGGLAYEAINNAGQLHSNLTIVLNDNKMSISENVGGMSAHLSRLRTSSKYTGLKDSVEQSLKNVPGGDAVINSIRRTKNGIKQLVIPGMVFEQMGIMYLGPVDGHNISAMENIFRHAFSYKGPVIVHVITRKGKGYLPAERHPARFHGTGAFELSTGIPSEEHVVSYTDVFATVMRKLGERNDRVIAVTAAMEDGTGLKRFHNVFPERFFDVGIAEEHAVTFASAMSKCGYIPVFAVYSSFLQRAYDEIIHDVCINKAHVIFAIDRAGIVGRDGITHQGIFDLSYLSTMPGMTIMAPKNKWELSDMMKFAVECKGPVAVRYPRGEASISFEDKREEIRYGKCEVISDSSGSDQSKGRILVFALGSMNEPAGNVCKMLTDDGYSVMHVNACFAKPFDKDFLKEKAEDYDLIVSMEENVTSGGFGEHVSAYLYSPQLKYKGKFLNISIPDCFVQQGSQEELRKQQGLDAESVYDRIKSMLDTSE